MRFWKAGTAAALVVGAAAALQLGGTDVHGQAIRDLDVSEPFERAVQVLSIGGGSRIGANIRDVDATDVAAKKLASEAGVLVEDVEESAPAAKAGLKAGDVIIEFDGERVRSESQLRRLIQETPAGRKIGLGVSRDGQRMTFTIEPEARRTNAPFLERFQVTPRAPRAPRAPSMSRVYPTPAPDFFRDGRVEVFPEAFVYSMGGGRLGVGTQTLTGQLAQHFGVERGVLVTSVTENSAAAKAGLRAGDVITKVNGTSIDDTGDLVRRLVEASGEVAIEIVRDRKTQTVKATVEPPRGRTLRRVI